MNKGPGVERLNVSREHGLAAHMLLAYLHHVCSEAQMDPRHQRGPVSHWKLVCSMSPFPSLRTPSFKPSPYP